MNFIMFPQQMNYMVLPVFYYPSFSDMDKLQQGGSQEFNMEEEKILDSFPNKLNITTQDLLKVGYNNKRASWTQEEDKKLLQLAKSQNLNWEEVSKKISGRNPKMCYSRYRRLSYYTKKRWSAEEQRQILELIQKEGMNWKKIAEQMKGRNPKQIQQHYEYCMNSSINRSQWTIEQDIRLIKLLQQYGTEWKKLEKEMRNRTENQIKNRYFGRLLKISKKKQKERLLNHTKSSKRKINQ